MYHNLVLDQMFDTNPLLQTTNLFTGPIRPGLRTIMAQLWYVIPQFLSGSNYLIRLKVKPFQCDGQLCLYLDYNTL